VQGAILGGPEVRQNMLNPFLSLNKDEKCLGFFYLGIFHSKKKKTGRKSVDKKTQWFR